MIRRPPRSTLDRSSAASDVYKRQPRLRARPRTGGGRGAAGGSIGAGRMAGRADGRVPVSYTHLRAHETVLDLVCRLLLEKKKNSYTIYTMYSSTNHSESKYLYQ